MQVGPGIPVETQLQKAQVGSTSGPTWRISHFDIGPHGGLHVARVDHVRGDARALELGRQLARGLIQGHLG